VNERFGDQPCNERMSLGASGTGTLAISVGAPALFVFLWSTGFIGAKLGLPYAGPLTILAIRFALAAALLGLVSLAVRAPWPHRPMELVHYATAGLLVHAVYLGGAFVGMSLGVEAGVTALIASLQPLLVAVLSRFTLGERVAWHQWLGLVIGLLGVVLILARKLDQGLGSTTGALACVIGLFGITAGTLYQKRHCAGMDLRTGNVVQYAAAGAVTGLLALLVEDNRVTWAPELIFALAWLVLVLSLGAIPLFYLLIRRGAAARVSSLFFLVPPTTALIAWPLLGESLGPPELAGMALTVTGVMLASRPGR
jgi:drug/metabolite transporter (DMT)-like permease